MPHYMPRDRRNTNRERVRSSSATISLARYHRAYHLASHSSIGSNWRYQSLQLKAPSFYGF